MGCCFSSSSGGPDKEIDEIALPEVFPYRVGGVNLDHSYSDRPWYKRFDLICPIIVILLFGLLVSWALMSSGTSFTDSKHPEIASGTFQPIESRSIYLQSSQIRAEAQDFITKLRKAGIKLVLFDMDNTATSAHANGCLTTESEDIKHSPDLDHYVASASVHFKYIVPMLLEKEEFKVAIVTFSDKKWYDDEKDHPKSLAGEDLVKAFLKGVFEGLDVDFEKIEMLGKYAGKHSKKWYPKLDDLKERNKNTHIAEMCRRFGVPASNAVLFDDDPNNVVGANEHTDATAYLVDRDTGRGFEFRYFDDRYRKTLR
eukprot:878933_1